MAETERITLPVELAVSSETVTVKDVSVKTTSGTPEIVQLGLLIERPVGRSGEILHLLLDEVPMRVVGETDKGEKILTRVPEALE